MSTRPVRATPRAGQESVWDYPRPPSLEPVTKRIQVIFHGRSIVDTSRAWRVLETSHPPVYYLPQDDIQMQYLFTAGGSSYCEWKGAAAYYDVFVGDAEAMKAAWTFPNPAPAFEPIKDHMAFYAWAMDRCLIDDEVVRPQPGKFYGGWITNDIVGPFKGVPGSSSW